MRRFNELLWLWIPGAIALGLIVPDVSRLEPFTLLLLALIVGGVAYTLDLHRLRGLPLSRLPLWIVAHALMIPLAWGLTHLFALRPVHAAGLILLGASTPDLTAPLLTRLARGATGASMLLLAVAGLTSIVLIPVSVHLLIDPGLRVPLDDVFRVLLAGILLPALIAIGLRRAFAKELQDMEIAVGLSTLATLAITAVVAGANRELLLGAPGTVPWTRILGSALLLFAGGLLIGHVAGRVLSSASPALARGGLFIPGTREYALAAALVLAAGFPAEAALLPLVFGGLQMVLAPLLAHRLCRTVPKHPPTR